MNPGTIHHRVVSTRPDHGLFHRLIDLRRRLAVVAALALVASMVVLTPAPPASAATFTVTTTADSGPGSLRAVIFDANATPGLDTISFAIPGAGPHSIQPATQLPQITDPVLIDGFSQPGAVANSNPFGSPVNASLMVELNGNGGGGTGLSLASGSSGSTIQGLVIRDFSSVGIGLFGSGGGNVIRGNFIGTDPTGTIASGNGNDGIQVQSSNNVIGGPNASDRNVIADNPNSGVGLGLAASLNTVQGNYIGTDISGTASLGNFRGVNVNGSGNLIGGSGTGEGNVISANASRGVRIGNPSGTSNVVAGNVIGLDATASSALGNGVEGIVVQQGASNNTIGGTAVGAGNTIGANGVGVLLSGGAVTGNSILGNHL